MTTDDTPTHVGRGRWKIPAGSLVVDTMLVLTLAYAAGQWTKAVEALDIRLNRLELQAITPEAARRISVVESQLIHMEEDRRTMMEQLDRIEDKLDNHMDGVRHPQRSDRP